ncbi:LOW QUALITY PROTEIN: RNA/RNP complex-1-interacting phosphatase [Rhynchocyon petersi]
MSHWHHAIVTGSEEGAFLGQLYYLPIGQPTPGTRFIPFKVPWKKSFEGNLASRECFFPFGIFNKIQEWNKKLIIDLIYTQSYYIHADLTETIPYLKIFTIGHQEPDDDTIFKFKHAVNGFLKENKINEKLIGVYCIHQNWLSYLHIQGMRSDDATELFNSCWNHCLGRKNYTEDLRNGPTRRNWASKLFTKELILECEARYQYSSPASVAPSPQTFQEIVPLTVLGKAQGDRPPQGHLEMENSMGLGK